jgi:hypothetical protein
MWELPEQFLGKKDQLKLMKIQGCRFFSYRKENRFQVVNITKSLKIIFCSIPVTNRYGIRAHLPMLL